MINVSNNNDSTIYILTNHPPPSPYPSFNHSPLIALIALKKPEFSPWRYEES